MNSFENSFLGTLPISVPDASNLFQTRAICAPKILLSYMNILGQQSTARRATQHAEAERRRDLCDVAPTSPVHTLFLAQSLFRRATQNGSHCSPRPRSRSLVVRSVSSVSLRIVALPAADAASRVNGPT